jgi:hypothetical protein
MTVSYKIEQINDNELAIECGLEEAYELVRKSIAVVGILEGDDDESLLIRATIKYGGSSAETQVSFVEREPGTTLVLIKSVAGDSEKEAAVGATTRLVEAIRNHDDSGHKPDTPASGSAGESSGQSGTARLAILPVFAICWFGTTIWLILMNGGFVTDRALKESVLVAFLLQLLPLFASAVARDCEASRGVVTSVYIGSLILISMYFLT